MLCDFGNYFQGYSQEDTSFRKEGVFFFFSLEEKMCSEIVNGNCVIYWMLIYSINLRCTLSMILDFF